MRISDWSSDVCSSDLPWAHRRGEDRRMRLLERLDHPAVTEAGVDRLFELDRPELALDVPGRFARPNLLDHVDRFDHHRVAIGRERDRKSVVSGKSVSVRVDLGGRRNIQKKRHISRIYKTTKI